MWLKLMMGGTDDDDDVVETDDGACFQRQQLVPKEGGKHPPWGRNGCGGVE